MDLPLSERERAIIALQVRGELPRCRHEEEDDPWFRSSIWSFDEDMEDNDDGQKDTV